MNKFLVAAVALFTGATVGGLFANYPSLREYDRPQEAFKEVKQEVNASTVALKTLDVTKYTVITLFSEVTEISTNLVLAEIMLANESNNKPILLLLDSPGGSVMDGARIISAIQSSKNKISTVCMQLCASMAAMILSYGEARYAVDRSIVMFHPASVQTRVADELDKVVSRFSFVQRYVDKMDHYVAARSKQSYSEFKALSSKELWRDAEDALAQNYIDAIVRLRFETEASPAPSKSNRLKQNINLYDDVD